LNFSLLHLLLKLISYSIFSPSIFSPITMCTRNFVRYACGHERRNLSEPWTFCEKWKNVFSLYIWRYCDGGDGDIYTDKVTELDDRCRDCVRGERWLMQTLNPKQVHLPMTRGRLTLKSNPDQMSTALCCQQGVMWVMHDWYIGRSPLYQITMLAKVRCEV
jgi:hypothetical protein